MAEQRAIGAVEQILGRVLRLPYCKPREIQDLDRAYAFVASPNFAEAAQNLVDALVENGFNRQETQDFIKPIDAEQILLGLKSARRKMPPKVIVLTEVPDPQKLSSDLLEKIEEEKITGYRLEARKKVYQEILFAQGENRVVVSPEKCFTFSPDQYPSRYPCPSSDSFNRHYYPKVGDLDDRGEEYLCVQFIDQMEEVEFWVRNLDRQEKFSFWLQTATDKFYPDFVYKLKDGRYLVVEDKGADRWSNDDSKEKRRLGELWAMKSGGSCLYSSNAPEESPKSK